MRNQLLTGIYLTDIKDQKELLRWEKQQGRKVVFYLKRTLWQAVLRKLQAEKPRAKKPWKISNRTVRDACIFYATQRELELLPSLCSVVYSLSANP